ncbi:MAG: thiol-disulfide oxidoreductase DCC family protein [Akkermansiaceae bacterium]
MSKKHILFLDGDCVFCQTSAQRLHRLDQQKHIYFSTLQGETASSLPDDWRVLETADGTATGAAVLAEDVGENTPHYWRAADAMLRSFYLAGGVLKCLWLFHWLPLRLRDSLYHWLSEHRHLLTPAGAQCPIPNETFKKQILP